MEEIEERGESREEREERRERRPFGSGVLRSLCFRHQTLCVAVSS